MKYAKTQINSRYNDKKTILQKDQKYFVVSMKWITIYHKQCFLLNIKFSFISRNLSTTFEKNLIPTNCYH